jgi:hypothetical protein
MAFKAPHLAAGLILEESSTERGQGRGFYLVSVGVQKGAKDLEHGFFGAEFPCAEQLSVFCRHLFGRNVVHAKQPIRRRDQFLELQVRPFPPLFFQGHLPAFVA